MGSRRTTPTWPGGGGGRLRAHGRADEHAVLPVAALEDERRHARAPAAEDDRRERHALRVLPARRHGRALARGRREARVRMRGLARAVPGLALPVDAGPRAGACPCPPTTGTPSGVTATFVKIVSWLIVAIAFGFVSGPVPGTTPKKPASGFTAHSRPSGAGPQPGDVVADRAHLVALGLERRRSIARLVLPQADGKAAPT